MKGSMSNRSHRSMTMRVVEAAALVAVCVGVFPGCRFLITNWDQSENDGGNGHFKTIWKVNSVKNYGDVRWGDLSDLSAQIDLSMIPTFWFNQKTIWPSTISMYADSVLERGKNPGLGVRGLHAQGLTGEGVIVAIIDQNICLDHPEYAGKVTKYHDVGTNQPANSSSMHGPAVLSLLVGTTIGTAPGAKVYFAAAPSWTADAKYQADALNWIIDENRQLPAAHKIRVVSISAAPSGPGTPFTKNNTSWDSARALAEREGILVLDCTVDHGKTRAGYYDSQSPDSLPGFTLGYFGIKSDLDTGRLYIPVSKRTTAEEYDAGVCEYQYDGIGGLSWSIPYLTGVLALGWQLKPELTGNKLLDLAFKSAFHKDGGSVINPTAFIDSVRAIH
jgi:serine protease AprX